MVAAFTLMLGLLVPFLIGRGTGLSVIRGERIAGIVGATLLPLVMWLVVLGWQGFGPDIGEEGFRYLLIVGGVSAGLLTPPAFGMALLGNRLARAVRRRRGRSARTD